MSAAPSAHEIKINAFDLAKGIEIHVRLAGATALRWRIKLACWIFLLGGKVAGVKGVLVDVDRRLRPGGGDEWTE